MYIPAAPHFLLVIRLYFFHSQCGHSLFQAVISADNLSYCLGSDKECIFINIKFRVMVIDRLFYALGCAADEEIAAGNHFSIVSKVIRR